MIVKEITVGKKFNLGNYESEEIRITVEPTQEETTNIGTSGTPQSIKEWDDITKNVVTQLHEEIQKLHDKINGGKEAPWDS